MTAQEFIELVIKIARGNGYPVETNRNGQEQIDFGNKKIHSGHLEQLFPGILDQDVNVSSLIDAVAPGRPCVHRPMREIIESIQQRVLLGS